MNRPNPDVAADFPPECAALYPDGFRYPVGYLPAFNRVVDPLTLESFDPLLRPYIVCDREGKAVLDPHAPVAVRRLIKDGDSNLLSVIRYLELEGDPDASMQETYACENVVALADQLSQAGHHGRAIQAIRTLPVPFQQTASALRSLAVSMKALGSYEQALEQIRRLIRSDEITEACRDLARIEEADLLVLLGRASEAEEIVRRGRETLRRFYTYYGVRAALALLAGDELLARQLIMRAGQIDPYHSYKLLWEAALRPLWHFIRRELLDEDNAPRLYRQNSDTRRLCHRIQGAILTGDRIGAERLMEGVELGHVTDWQSSEEAVLCLIGLGAFAKAEACVLLPGAEFPALRLAQALIRCRMERPSLCADEMTKLFDAAQGSTRNRAHFSELLRCIAARSYHDLPSPTETLLADIGDQWSDMGRERFRLVHVRDEGYSAVGFMEDRTCFGDSDGDPRDHFAATRTFRFDSGVEAEEWLEEKLRANVDLPQDELYRRRWHIQLSGWGCLTKLHPKADRTSLLQEAWQRMRSDPNLYFSNGPASSFSLPFAFGDRLALILVVGSSLAPGFSTDHR